MNIIEFSNDDIFKSDAEALVNPVNCVGIMGKGLALQFKQRFPKNFEHYQNWCKEKPTAGCIMCFKTDLEQPKYIINFATKNHWRDKSSLIDIEEGLKILINIISFHKINSIAIPALGAGLGGLDWNEVKPLISDIMRSFQPDVHTIIYPPR